MNRIETKIIIMVTNQLASAKESEAKTEMIEELSENLYQRYLGLTEQGKSEEEAFAEAMESLGDVEELLAFLKETEEEENLEVNVDSKENEDSKKSGERSSGFEKDLENGIEAIVNIAQATAKAAQTTAKATVNCARDVARDVSEQWRERYPDGVFSRYDASKGQKVEGTSVMVTDDIHSLDIRLMNGDLSICADDKDESVIEVEGDTQDIEMIVQNDGTLSILQENTASASFFFQRGMRYCHIAVTLPRKLWDRINLSTMNGDIRAEEPECRELKITTVSGDLKLENVVSDQTTCHSASGDIRIKDLKGILYAATKSGDVKVRGKLERCELRSISGDVEFCGESGEVKCSSTSGDVQIDMENVPQKMEVSSVSGDCDIRIPHTEQMHISYRTVNGGFSTNLPMTVNMTKKRGEMTLGDGMGAQIRVSSTSGDIGVFEK